jgi:hypothetical protein
MASSFTKQLPQGYATRLMITERFRDMANTDEMKQEQVAGSDSQ